MPNTEVTGTDESNVIRMDDLARGNGAVAAMAGVKPPSHKGGRSEHITDLLVEMGYATREEVDAAVEEARESPALSPKQILLDRAVISPDQLSRAMAERFGLDYLNLSEFNVNPAAAGLIGIETARRYRAVPVEFVAEGTILLAMADPANVLAIDDISILTGQAVKPAVAPPTDIEALIAQLSTLDDSIEAAISIEEDEEDAAEITDIRETADDAPIVKLTHALISQALEARASDIHLEPAESDMKVRYRVDGVLTDAISLPQRMVLGVISRVKVMADLDIAEHRIPQDGRVGLKIDGHPIDIRVVTLPSVHGEAVVMRLLDKEQTVSGLRGLEGELLDTFEQAIAKPYGATLVTGPTGSGKTTTLYSGLQMINTREKSVLTIEDPVEYQMAGITQMQVNNKAGLGFSNGLRSMLRADPDVIMVGEIRDQETARIAVEAALTGHLVLTTLHTNDAPSAITRLIDMGIEPFLIASAMDCVVAQRLARTLCGDCKRAVEIEPVALRASGFDIEESQQPVAAFEPVGCTRCSQTGFRGRVGVFELMKVSEEIRDMTLRCSSVDEIRRQARSEGMRTLREDGLVKIEQGVSSVDEIARIIA